jgi:hypothetical protein
MASKYAVLRGQLLEWKTLRQVVAQPRMHPEEARSAVSTDEGFLRSK